MEAYCMKCKEKREAKDVKAVTMKNGKPAQEGVCPVCGTKMFKIGAAKNPEPEKEETKRAETQSTGVTKTKSTTKAKTTKK
jgi:NAD-dependent SIR2 family protein deacetylase